MFYLPFFGNYLIILYFLMGIFQIAITLLMQVCPPRDVAKDNMYVCMDLLKISLVKLSCLFNIASIELAMPGNLSSNSKQECGVELASF